MITSSATPKREWAGDPGWISSSSSVYCVMAFSGSQWFRKHWLSPCFGVCLRRRSSTKVRKLGPGYLGRQKLVLWEKILIWCQLIQLLWELPWSPLRPYPLRKTVSCFRHDLGPEAFCCLGNYFQGCYDSLLLGWGPEESKMYWKESWQPILGPPALKSCSCFSFLFLICIPHSFTLINFPTIFRIYTPVKFPTISYYTSVPVCAYTYKRILMCACIGVCFVCGHMYVYRSCFTNEISQSRGKISGTHRKSSLIDSQLQAF